MERHTDSGKSVRRTPLIAALAAALVAGAAVAAERQPAFTMTVIHDAYFGKKVISGDYRTAIERIRPKRDDSPASFEAHTNLCVAYVKAGEVDRAGPACNAAVEAARAQAERASKFAPSYGEENWREYEAVALSNRGVLHAVAGRIELARLDFSEAIQLRTSIDAPGSNLARLADDAPM
jgi:Flp pilus assembly protein TadD